MMWLFIVHADLLYYCARYLLLGDDLYRVSVDACSLVTIYGWIFLRKGHLGYVPPPSTMLYSSSISSVLYGDPTFCPLVLNRLSQSCCHRKYNATRRAKVLITFVYTSQDDRSLFICGTKYSFLQIINNFVKVTLSVSDRNGYKIKKKYGF